jgi:hypothetical protein
MTLYMAEVDIAVDGASVGGHGPLSTGYFFGVDG